MLRFLRFFFKQLYHGFAWSYDFVAATVSIGRWRGWVLAALPNLQGPRVLELGHGPGHLQVAMSSRGLAPIGLDESGPMGRQAHARLRRQGLAARLVSGYAQRLPFMSAVFDTVVATFPTEYIFEAQTLAEVLRVLRPGGTLVVIPTAWIGGGRLPDRAAAWLFRVTRQGSPLPEALQQRLKLPFREAGFEVRIEPVVQPSSTVLVLLARKPLAL